MSVEERIERLEIQNKRFRLAFTVLVVALCGVVTMAATGDKVGQFEEITATRILVKDEMGKLGASISTANGAGMLTLWTGKGMPLMIMSDTENGGHVQIFNKTGETVVTLEIDEYGNGQVGAWNRKGMGRTLKPGPQ
jgi:hypothetical protein